MFSQSQLGIGLYQCMGAVPTVFDVRIPEQATDAKKWLDILEYPATLGFDFILPGSCYGTSLSRLVVNALWPFGLVFLTTVSGAIWELRSGVRSAHGAYSAVRIGLQRTLPLALVLSFVLLPSQSIRILKVFLCDDFGFDDAVVNGSATRRCECAPMPSNVCEVLTPHAPLADLHDDLAIRCDSSEYSQIRSVAILFVVVWPIAIPSLYILLLWLSRKALLSGSATSLSRTIGFLHVDYGVRYSNSSHYQPFVAHDHKAWSLALTCCSARAAEPRMFWWEPVEMIRKISITGWVLIVSEEYEHLRVLLALVVSITSLALHLALKPFVSAADNAIAATMQLCLVILYLTVLLIKFCDLGAESCAVFGLGSTGDGIFYFFVSFALGLLLLLLALAVANLWFTKNVSPTCEPRTFTTNGRVLHGATTHVSALIRSVYSLHDRCPRFFWLQENMPFHHRQSFCECSFEDLGG